MVAFNQATLTPANTSTFIGLSTPYGVNVRGTRIYVANWGTQNILVYNKCGGAPVAPAIPDSTGVPLGLAFDTAGNLYVSNYYDNGGAQGEVRYYANATGSGVPIGDPLERYVSFVTVNTNGDVFAAGTSGPGSSFHVDWCHNTSTNHCKQGTATWQNTGIPLTNWPGGVRIDSNGNLVVSDQLGNMGVYTVPGFQQLSSLPCPGAGGTLSDCGDFGFNQTGNRLFLADFQYGALYRVNYPSFASPIVDGGMSQVAAAAAWPGPSWGG